MLEKTIEVKERRPLHLLGLEDKIKDYIFCNRNVQSIEQLDYSITNLLNPSGFKDLEKAIDRLVKALINNETIVIIGDYDADGATSTALMYMSLHQMGYEHVHYIIPDRVKDGYGLIPALVDQALDQFAADLIITVDNGISSFEGVDHANKVGVDVVITDHHLAGDTVPLACAIINPNQKDCNFASKNLAGVGVAYYLMKVLNHYIQGNLEHIANAIELKKALLKLGVQCLLTDNSSVKEGNNHSSSQTNTAKKKRNSPERLSNFLKLYNPHFNPDQYLDLVAVGTVADLAQLDYNNRILVEQGIRRIRARDCCVGLQAILKVQKIDNANFCSDDIGFRVAPLINAIGRMEHMAKGVECLISDNLQAAQDIALQMSSTNKKRSELQAENTASAFEQFANTLADSENVSICLYDPSWHQGLIGLNSSIIKDKYWRPTFVFAQESEGKIKGSGRSINDLHIKDCLDLIASRHPGLLVRFGGHSGAAGVTIAEENFELFSQVFDETVREMVAEECIGCEVIYVDLELPVSYITKEFAAEIARMGPWGKGFPEPVFKGIFRLAERRIVGKNRDTLLLELLDKGNNTHRAIKFKINQEMVNRLEAEMEVYYSLSINRYANRETLNLVIKHMAPVRR